jgi:hypothetical protein
MAPNEHPQTPGGFERQADASSRHDLRGALAGLTMPVHVISGEHDVLVPRWKQEELAAGFPGARLTVIQGGAHSLTLEKRRSSTPPSSTSSPTRPSVLEVPAVREDHRDAGLVGGLHDLGIALGAARLDDAGRARVDRELRPVGEREERVARHR